MARFGTYAFMIIIGAGRDPQPVTRGASLRYSKGRDSKSCPHRHLSHWELCP